ncbi:MAG: hypothetical protein WCC60_00375 [Ilumatobacteraceae bacterium]
MQIRRRALDAWLHDLRVGWGERAFRSVDAITPVVAVGQLGDLHTIGHHLATEGQQLDDVLTWFRLLATRSRAFRHLLERGGIINLASGWADGVLHQEYGAQAVAPFEVLRLRLQQQVELTSSLGESPGTHLALVVIECHGAPDCAARVTHHARATFSAGETIAATPSGKLLVLVHRDQDVRRRTLRLADALRHDDQLRGSPVRVWIEPLAMAAEHIDSHLLGLAS